MGQPDIADIIVRLPTAQDREPASSGRLCVYVDETTLHVDGRQMFGVGVLLTPSPVEPGVVARAMLALHADPDRDPASVRYEPFRARLDQVTLARGHFHASEDSANARSPLAREIAAHVTGNYAFSFAEVKAETDRVRYRAHALRSLHALLQTRKPVHCTFERGPGMTNESAAQAMLEDMRRGLDFCAYEQPLMRSYYPEMTVAVDDKSNTGLQVADMLLWSMGQELFFLGSRKSTWASRCGIRKWADASIPEAEMRWVQCRVNNRNPLFAHAPDHAVPYPVGIDELKAETDDLTIANCCASAERVLRRVSVRGLPAHAEHLRPAVIAALAMLERPDAVGATAIRAIASAFVRVFDTLPIYNGMPGDGPHPQWLPFLRARHFLGLALHADAVAQFLAQVRREHVGDQPEVYGLSSR